MNKNTMYAYTAKSGVRVESTVPPERETVVTALYGEYSRWLRRFLGKGR